MAIPYNPWFEESLIVDPAGVAETKAITFDFTDNPQLTAFSDSIVSSPAPAISWVNPSGQVTLLYTTPTVSGDRVTTQLTTNGAPAYVGNTPYVVTIRVYTSQGQILEKNCTLSLDAPGYTPFNPGPPIVPNGPTGNFSGLQLNDGIVSITPTFQFKTTDIASVTAAGTFINPGQVATSIELASSGQVLGLTAIPTAISSYATANIPAATSVAAGTVIQVTDGTRSRLASNGTNWVDISGGIVYSADFGDDPTGASSSWAAWQAALTALSIVGNGKLIIKAPAAPYPTGFYKFDQTLVRQPNGNVANGTITIEFLGNQNQILWTGPQYAVGLLSMGMYNCKCINFSPRNVNSANNNRGVDGFVAFDHRVDYWWNSNSQLTYEKCSPNLGASSSTSGQSGMNCVAFRIGQGGSNSTGGAGVVNCKFIDCNVTSQSFAGTPVQELGCLPFQIGGNNSYPIDINFSSALRCWWNYWAGMKYTNSPSPFFLPTDTTINVASTVGFPPTGFLLLWTSYNASPCELVYYTGKTATSFTGLTRGLNGTTPMAGTANTIISDFLTDVYGAVAFTTAKINAGDLTISVNNSNSLSASGTIQITSATGINSTGIINGQCYPYETINYSANSGGTLTIPASNGRAQLGSSALAFAFTLPPALAASMSASGSLGSFPAETVWGQITFVNAHGETTPGPIVSLPVSANNTLTVTKPYALVTSNSPATGWNFYLGVGSTQPANSAMYLQNGTPTSLSSNLSLASPTLSGTNPPTTNTATGGNGFAVFQRKYGPSVGALLPAGLVSIKDFASLGCSNSWAFNGPHSAAISHDECEGVLGTYLFTGLLPGLGQIGAVSNVVVDDSTRVVSGGWSGQKPPSSNTTSPLVTPPASALTVNPTGGGTTGGNLYAGNYYVVITYTNASGETTPSPEMLTAFTVALGNIPQITGIPTSAPTNATGYNIYLTPAGGSPGTEFLYNSSPQSFSSGTFNLSSTLVTPQKVIYLNCPTAFEMTAGSIRSTNSQLGAQTIFSKSPSHIRMAGVGLNAIDPFIGDASAQSLIEIPGCFPTDNFGNRISIAPYNLSPFYTASGNAIIIPDASTVGVPFANNATFFLLLTTTVGANRTINCFNKLNGSRVTFIFRQSASGGGNVNWGTGFTNLIWIDSATGNIVSGVDGSQPILNQAANSFTIVTFDIINNGATYFMIGRCNFASTNANTIGSILSSSTKGIGYTSGAGGTVTQTGSKSTAVTLNKPSGQITLNSASLGGNSVVSFSFNNTTLLANDKIEFQPVGTSASDPSAYLIVASNIVAGTSCTVTLRNLTSGSLAEAVTFQFSIVRGATT